MGLFCFVGKVLLTHRLHLFCPEIAHVKVAHSILIFLSSIFSVPRIPWAFAMTEVCGVVLCYIWLLVLLLHRHRYSSVAFILEIADNLVWRSCVYLSLLQFRRKIERDLIPHEEGILKSTPCKQVAGGIHGSYSTCWEVDVQQWGRWFHHSHKTVEQVDWWHEKMVPDLWSKL